MPRPAENRFSRPSDPKRVVALVVLVWIAGISGIGYGIYYVGGVLFGVESVQIRSKTAELSERGNAGNSLSVDVGRGGAASGDGVSAGDTKGSDFNGSYAQRGLAEAVSDGALFIRIFKQSGSLEVWSWEKSHYRLLQTFGLCRASKKFAGKALGPKRRLDDGVLPEGFYHVPVALLSWRQKEAAGRLAIGYPNTFDLGRDWSGEAVYVVGDCQKAAPGFFALADKDMATLLDSVEEAKKHGQKVFPIHIFPFRMEWSKLSSHKGRKNYQFWLNLKEVYDHFEKSRTIPFIGVCGLRYWLTDNISEGVKRVDEDYGCLPLQPAREIRYKTASRHTWLMKALMDQNLAFWTSKRAISEIEVKCNLKRPACRRWYSLRKKMIANGQVPPELTEAQ